MEENKFNFPTEIVELPSKGLVYPEGHPLRSGKVEMKYMTAKEEDILSNQNFISKGIVLDKLLESLTLGKIDIKDLITGDKNAIFIAARILGYGKDYTFSYSGKEYTVDLSTIENKIFDDSLISLKGTFFFTLPKSETIVEFKLLSEKDEEKIKQEIEGFKKINKDSSTDITTRLKHQIVSVDNNNDKNSIKDFVDNYLLAMDSRALRSYIKKISPDIDLNYKITINGTEEDIDIPINLNFFWPDLK
jgi:hypothetical protein